ncbi:hypothetical protein TY91_11705 [Secundilactobacillus collinoides]|uniref:Uncharacterized protein n=2 Tax=Secundilactobacillus collinoides TaxID=33960 RepID=A0A166GD28_SECCO|nr:hypothetical protein TY91_11705 [Secundilactobacillus collinoides]
MCAGTNHGVVVIMKMINCQYGYVSPIELKVFSELDRELKQKQRRAKQHGAFNLHKGGDDHAKSKTL